MPFLKAAYYKSLGVTVTRAMTDNGSCYQAFAFRDACRDLGIKHIRTKPYTPKQTERPSASFRPRFESCRSGCTNTTGTDPTVV